MTTLQATLNETWFITHPPSRPSEAERASSRVQGRKRGRRLPAGAGRLCAGGAVHVFAPSRGARYASSGASPAGRFLPESIHPSFAQIEGALVNIRREDTSDNDEKEGGA